MINIILINMNLNNFNGFNLGQNNSDEQNRTWGEGCSLSGSPIHHTFLIFNPLTLKIISSYDLGDNVKHPR